MNLGFMTADDWGVLVKKYPHLESDVAALSQPREIAFIRKQLTNNYITPGRRKWLEQRLADLTQFDEMEEPK